MTDSPPYSLDRGPTVVPGDDARGAGERFALLVCVLLGVYALYDAAVFYATQEQRVVYALAAGPVILGGAAVAGAVPLARRTWMTVLLLMALVLLPLATGLARPGLHPDHLLGDTVTLVVPLAFLLLAAAVPTLRRDGRPVRVLLFLLVVAAAVAPLLGRNPSGRFEPPSPLLACAALTVFVHRPGRARWAAAVAYGLLFVLVLGSLERTMILLWVGMPFAALTLRRGLRVTLFPVLAAAALLALVLALLPADAREDLIGRLRLRPIAEGEVDPSLVERFEEVRDIRGEMRTWSLPQWFAGAGHGACWELWDATPHAQNVQPDGTVHHVHITPVALAYRCGLPGALAALLFAALALRPFLTLRGAAGRPGTGDDATTFFRLGALSYLLTALLSAALVDPLLSFVLAGRLLTGDRAEQGGRIS